MITQTNECTLVFRVVGNAAVNRQFGTTDDIPLQYGLYAFQLFHYVRFVGLT